jgi:hypothetical protein
LILEPDRDSSGRSKGKDVVVCLFVPVKGRELVVEGVPVS